MPQSWRRRDAPVRARITGDLRPGSPAKRSASREEATAIPPHGIFPGLRRKRLTRAIGNLRYCSPGTRIAPPPGEEHGVEEFPGGDAAHLSGLPDGVLYAKKKPVLAYELFLKYGGEGGIRTPDTLPYTHFPGVLLQPLGHLTILSFPLLLGTGANVGKYVSPVNQLF